MTNNALQTVTNIEELPVFRVTGLAKFSECPARWRAEMTADGFSADAEKQGRSGRPMTDYAAIGTAAHVVIEQFLRGAFTTENWAPRDAYLKSHGMNEKECNNVRRYCDCLEERYGGIEKILETPILASLVEGATPVRGTLDCVMFDEENQNWLIHNIFFHFLVRNSEKKEMKIYK